MPLLPHEKAFVDLLVAKLNSHDADQAKEQVEGVRLLANMLIKPGRYSRADIPSEYLELDEQGRAERALILLQNAEEVCATALTLGYDGFRELARIVFYNRILIAKEAGFDPPRPVPARTPVRSTEAPPNTLGNPDMPRPRRPVSLKLVATGQKGQPGKSN